MTEYVSHTAHRPTWQCRNCDQPWPCETARKQILDEMADFPTVRRVYLDGMLAAAARELPATTGGELHERFVGWAG